MAIWTRDEPWRQGQILPVELARQCELVSSDDLESVAIVIISHDCDIAAEVEIEPNVEVIIGSFVSSISGNLTNAKNVRTLQIQYQSAAGNRIVELRSAKRTKIAKERLQEFAPHEDFFMDALSKRTLQKWLSARYDRAAFPNDFEARLKSAKTAEAIAEILKPSNDSIRAIYFDLGKHSDVDHLPSDEPYELEIYLLHVTEPDAREALEVANNVRHKLIGCFKKKHCSADGRWRGIELVECIVVSDEAMTVRQSLTLRQWRLDHMSLRENTNGPMAG